MSRFTDFLKATLVIAGTIALITVITRKSAKNDPFTTTKKSPDPTPEAKIDPKKEESPTPTPVSEPASEPEESKSKRAKRVAREKREAKKKAKDAVMSTKESRSFKSTGLWKLEL